MKKIKSFLTVFLFVTLLQAQVKIFIQPIGNFDTTEIISMLPSISEEYSNSEIKIVKKIEMPRSAYYKPRNRYRAEKILSYLDSLYNLANVKVVGLTTLDISTTKGEYEDWGIFGFGDLSGTACVISTFRLKKNGNRLKERLRKVITHELGHTFGLGHCHRAQCVMAGYRGKMDNLDNTGYHLCASCRIKYNRDNKRE